MTCKIHSVAEDKRLELVTMSDFIERGGNRETFHWIDLSAPTDAETSEILTSLSIRPLIVERCVDRRAPASVTPYGDMVLLQYPFRGEWNDAERLILSIICLPGAIITIHPAPLAALEHLASDFKAALGLHRLDTSSLVYLITDRLVDETAAFALKARRTVDEFEEMMDQRSEAMSVGQTTLELKRAVAHFEIFLEEQHHCMTALLSVESEAFNSSNVREYIHDSIARLDHDMRHVERIEARLSELQDHHLLLVQEKTNRRVNILTILSAVFMPLTLVTGIYGMNFKFMPELEWRYGYMAIIATMLVIAIALMWFFVRKGWFK
ncbi:MAG: magnesium transporter CorA family protein [Alphaproteobacteria bacterium]